MDKHVQKCKFQALCVWHCTSLLDADMHKLLGRNTLLHTWIHQCQLHTRSKFTMPDTLSLDSKSMVEVRLPHSFVESKERTANPERHVLWAVYCTTFFGFFRLGELLQSSQAQFIPIFHISWGDMAVDNARDPKMLKCHLRQSKTDQCGRGWTLSSEAQAVSSVQ